MLMTEGCKDPRSAQFSDQRKAVRRRGAKAHPLLDMIGAKVRKYLVYMAPDQFERGSGGAFFDPPKLDRAGAAQAGGHGVHGELAGRDHQRVPGHLRGVDEMQVIAALGLQMNLNPQLAHQRFRPDASGKNRMVARHWSLIGLDPGDAPVGQSYVFDLAL